MANYFYNIKCVVPLYRLAETPKKISDKERVNLLSRNYIISGTKPVNAFTRFLNQVEDDEETLFGISATTNMALPLMDNIQYLVIIESSKKETYLLYTPRRVVEDQIIETNVEFVQENLTEENFMQFLEPTPLTALLSIRNPNETISDKALKYLDSHNDNQLQLMAHAVKAIKDDWIEPGGNDIEG